MLAPQLDELPVPTGLKLMPFQADGVRFMLERQNTLLGDEMGLGKTPQSIVFLNSVYWERALIVVPAFLRLNWFNELKRWLVKDADIFIVWDGKTLPPEVSAATLFEGGGRPQIIITSYDLLSQRIPQKGADGKPTDKKHWPLAPAAALMARTKYDVQICDEAHYLKNRKAFRTRATLAIKSQRFIAATGTPILNRPVEVWNLAHRCDPTTFNDYWHFVKRYCDAHDGGFGYDVSGASNLGELQQRLKASCFTGDTMIACEDGERTIKEIVERRIHCRVWCKGADNRLALQPVVAFSRKAHSGILVKIHTSLGTICCTPDHRIYAAQGEIRADEVVAGHHLLALRQESDSGIEAQRSSQANPRQQDTMLLQMRWSGETAGKKETIRRGAASSPINYREKLRRMWCEFYGKKYPWIFSQEILHEQMQGNLLRQKFGHSRQDAEGPHLEAESNQAKTTAKKESQREGGQDRQTSAFYKKEFSHTPNSGPFQTGESIGTFRGLAGRSDTLRGDGNICGRASTSKTCDRGGRCNPCAVFTEADGQRERCFLTLSRVLRVEILELGDRGGIAESNQENFVYDLEVEEHHNFFANGILAHNCMIRRLKKDVLTDLPAKTRQIIELPPTAQMRTTLNRENMQWEVHEETLAKLVERRDRAAILEDEDEYREAARLLKAAYAVAFEEMSRVRKETALAKLPLCINHIEDVLEQVDKLIVFAHHKDVIRQLADAFKEYGCMMFFGDTPQMERAANVQRFQEDPRCRVAIVGISAAVGITLTAASHEVFVESDWVPANLSQAEDRAHRIGQKNCVLVQHLVLEGSLDSKMLKTVISKQEVIDDALDVKPGSEQQHKAVQRRKINYAAIGEKLDVHQRGAILLALQKLTAMDGDKAQAKNGKGFSKFDSNIGHELAKMQELTAGRAGYGQHLVRRYRAQLDPILVHACGISENP